MIKKHPLKFMVDGVPNNEDIFFRANAPAKIQGKRILSNMVCNSGE